MDRDTSGGKSKRKMYTEYKFYERVYECSRSSDKMLAEGSRNRMFELIETLGKSTIDQFDREANLEALYVVVVKELEEVYTSLTTVSHIYLTTSNGSKAVVSSTFLPTRVAVSIRNQIDIARKYLSFLQEWSDDPKSGEFYSEIESYMTQELRPGLELCNIISREVV
jgi:hypothetical protein